MSKNFNDKISDYTGNGEPASNFGSNARVWSELAVRDAVISYSYNLERKLAEARDEIERLQDILQQINNWANAYPETVFTEPTNEQLDWVKEKIGAERMTALHGSWGRHITEGIRKIIDEAALTESQEDEQEPE